MILWYNTNLNFLKSENSCKLHYQNCMFKKRDYAFIFLKIKQHHYYTLLYFMITSTKYFLLYFSYSIKRLESCTHCISMSGCLIDTLSGLVCTGTLAASTPTRPDGIFIMGRKFATAKQNQTRLNQHSTVIMQPEKRAEL